MRPARLTPVNWAEAALDAISQGGIDAVGIDRIARQLGATKGSFYWHFDNRDALIEAALELWEQRRTEAVIDHLELEPDPARRIGLVLEGGLARGAADRVEIALLANPGHPSAARTLRRVVKRRIAYLATQFQTLGWNEADARDRATLVAYLYVGHLHLTHLAPQLAGTDARQRQAHIAIDALLPDHPRPQRPDPKRSPRTPGRPIGGRR